MKKLLHYIVSSIVDSPEEVKIKDSKTESGLIKYSISVAETDIGKVIGKKGRIIRGIRTLARTKAIKDNQKAIIALEED
jgi:predicted RNA-binding protein YlqC (UPF0109 family)